MSSLLHLLQGAEVVHPVELGLLLNQVVAAYEHVGLVGSFPERDRNLCTNESSYGLLIWLTASPVF